MRDFKQETCGERLLAKKNVELCDTEYEGQER